MYCLHKLNYAVVYPLWLDLYGYIKKIYIYIG